MIPDQVERPDPWNILIACEESQAVCIEMRKRGHNAFSCDLQECSGGHPEWHLQMDALEAVKMKQWDLMIAHPPCTYLSKIGAQHQGDERMKLRDEAINFFIRLWNSDIPRIGIENPIPMKCVVDRVGRYRQIIQPYYFGDKEMKTTCLWLKGLKRLSGLHHVALDVKAHKPTPAGHNARGNPYYFTETRSGKERAKLRSKTFPGIARAMAEQWTPLIKNIS